jgi:hypothetical protein
LNYSSETKDLQGSFAVLSVQQRPRWQSSPSSQLFHLPGQAPVSPIQWVPLLVRINQNRTPRILVTQGKFYLQQIRRTQENASKAITLGVGSLFEQGTYFLEGDRCYSDNTIIYTFHVMEMRL